jgi:DNA polymerase/3'-5' exonuclease PolX
MSDKKKFPRDDAIEVARELCAALEPVTERLVVAGSLRRRKLEVGDVEILFVPKMVKVQDGLFDIVEYSSADNVLIQLLGTRVLDQRKNVNGSTMWGAKNKLAVHVATGIPVDLFATTEECFFMALVIRTGPKDCNLRLIESAAKRGLKLHAYGVFERMSNGESIVPKSERAVFEIAGLPYKEPWERE